MTPAVFGISGPAVSPAEANFFRSADPVGFIIFARNIVDADQLYSLTNDLRASVGRDNIPILIDQEGGRVARMQPPIWPEFPAAQRFDSCYERAPMTAIEAARCNAHAIALMLRSVGITVNAAPLLDIRQPDTSAAIADRTFGQDPLRVAALGSAVLEGLRRGGIVGIIKHIPGQGRARTDTHHEVARVSASADDLALDLEPFTALRGALMAMTAHVVFDAWDPLLCATLSPTVIETVIRRQIGFDGLLMSDDLDMNALSGSVALRAVACVAAGCDVALNCAGRLADMEAIAAQLPSISNAGHRRLEAAMALCKISVDHTEIYDLIEKRDMLLRYA